MALEALTRIGQLYHIEQQSKALSIDARQQLRVEQSQPTLNALYEWLIQTRIKTANGGDSAKALDYTLKRWQSQIRYAETAILIMTKTYPIPDFGGRTILLFGA